MCEKIIIFGLGGKLAYEKENHRDFYDSLNVLAFCDNNAALWGTEYDGKQVVAPSDLLHCQFDWLVIASNYYKKIFCQLVEKGVDKDKIIHWDEYAARCSHKDKKVYLPEEAETGKRVLMISTMLEINGGTVAIINAAQALRMRGYSVSLCARDGIESMVDQALSKGVRVILYPSICYPDEDDIKWMAQYDFVIVNVYQMMRCAYVISQYRKVCWWIHECSEKYSDIYPKIQSVFFQYSKEQYENINVYAVSNIAKNVFKRYHPRQTVNIMPLGVPERDETGIAEREPALKYIFAVVGAIQPRKGQEDAVKAISLLNQTESELSYELWIIGKNSDADYFKKVEKRAETCSNIRFIGEVGVDEMSLLYKQIDVVICSSYEETMSLTIIEGMMKRKVCITTDQTGIAEYVVDHKNGFVCKAGNCEELAGILRWIIAHREECRGIACEARRTYEEHFTLERLGQQLETELLKS